MSEKQPFSHVLWKRCLQNFGEHRCQRVVFNIIAGSLKTFCCSKLCWHTVIQSEETVCRSSRPKVFCNKDVLLNFTKFKGKHMCQSLFLTKLQASACNFIKKETLALVFSCEFCEISRSTVSYRTPPMTASSAFILYFSIFGLNTWSSCILANSVHTKCRPSKLIFFPERS